MNFKRVLFLLMVITPSAYAMETITWDQLKPKLEERKQSFFGRLFENKIDIVEVGGSWCKPCRDLEPIMKDSEQKLASNDVTFYKIEVEPKRLPSGKKAFSAEDMAAFDALQIQGFPTVIIFKNGSEIDRQAGSEPTPEFAVEFYQWLVKQLN